MDTQYQRVALSEREKRPPHVSVSSFFSRSSRQSPVFTTKSRPKSWIWHILSHIVSFLWLAPIIALLVLNFKGHVVGSSAWCPSGHCSSDAGEDNAVARAARLDKNDHNLLGALQFVAKALEVWFMLIATALLFDMAMILARMEGGLPVGYLLTHLEFGDIRNLFNPLLWTSPLPHPNATESQKHRKSISRLFIFGVLAALLTILTNLMGPAAAVLVLPTLQWVDTIHKPAEIYQGLALDSSPQASSVFTSCNASELDAGNFSCTYASHAPSLDQFASTALLTEVQFEQDFGLRLSAISQESAMAFALNVTSDESLVWVPSRQVLRDLSVDYFQLEDPDTYGEGVTKLNDSLQVILQREGPSIGLQAYCSSGNVSVTNVANDKQVHCFSGWSEDNINNYTKCIRVGEGFNAKNKVANFWIGVSSPDTDINSTAADIYFSDSATYYNDTEDFGTGIKRCLSNETAPSCDWDTIFAIEALPVDLRNMSSNVLTTSYSLANTNASAFPMPGGQARVFCDAVAYISFPTYMLDTLDSTNVLRLVRMQGFTPYDKTPLVIHPDWFLAAWSVDRNGTVDQYREIAQEITRVLPSFWSNQPSYSSQELQLLQLYSLTQTMSMIPYSNTTVSSSSPNPSPANPSSVTQPRTLFIWASRHVWAYGISGSRTSKLGVTVVILGGICVIIRLILGAFLGKREHSPVELFVAALEHQPTGEFSGLEKEGLMAKVRYVMEEDESGRPRFVPERHWSGSSRGGRSGSASANGLGVVGVGTP